MVQASVDVLHQSLEGSIRPLEETSAPELCIGRFIIEQLHIHTQNNVSTECYIPECIVFTVKPRREYSMGKFLRVWLDSFFAVEGRFNAIAYQDI